MLTNFIQCIYSVWPSDLMMTFAFNNSSMNTEVARQPQPRSNSVLNSGGTGSQLLWSLPRLLCGVSPAAVSFWHRPSSKLAAALGTEPRHFGLSMAYPSRSLRLMWHHWSLALTVSLYRSFGRPWFLCRPGVPCTSGVSASDPPPFGSRVQPIEVGPWYICIYTNRT